MIVALVLLFGYYQLVDGAFRPSGRVPLSREVLAIGWVVIVVAMHFIPAVHDKLTRGRIHRASIWLPLVIIVWFVVLNTVIAPSALAFKVGSWLLK